VENGQPRMSPSERYQWLLLHWICVFGMIIRIFAVLFGFVSITDSLRYSHIGYPDYTILIDVAFFVAGHYISRLARYGLARMKEGRPI